MTKEELEKKRKKLEALDTAVLDAMTDALNNDDTAALRDLNVAVTYLKNNQVITPPEKDKGMGAKVKDAIE